jgi:ATP-dependent Clp protease ATP-binding subunit ClpB
MRRSGSEKKAIEKVRELREQLEQARRESEEAERAYDLDKVAKLRTADPANWSGAGRAEEKEASGAANGAAALLREEVTEEEIAEVVSRWTGIPADAAAGRASARSC